ncbi:MAG TPA: N-acetylmuramic acid 6-phosphate etherase [Pyrinomonadaceae bacterium]
MIPITETDNPNTAEIDKVSTLDAVRLINNEDRLVAIAVEKVLPAISTATEKIVERLRNGGRLFYIGTGTSGRLGVLDASEIPPTYGVSHDLVQGVIAGGYDALYKATEASEDNVSQGAEDLKARGLTEKDAVVGIAASGRTPYTIGAVKYARGLGCFTACIVCNPDSEITNAAEIPIVPVVGPEAITGSTRMKAGTAQKMILNMISTVAMIRLGYVKGNHMTNMKASNEKLQDRAVRILMDEAGLEETAASKLMDEAGGDLRVALVMKNAHASKQDAERALSERDFVVDDAVRDLSSSGTNDNGSATGQNRER